MTEMIATETQVKLASLVDINKPFFESDRNKTVKLVTEIIGSVDASFIGKFLPESATAENLVDSRFSLERIVAMGKLLMPQYVELVNRLCSLDSKNDKDVDSIIRELYSFVDKGDTLSDNEGVPKIVSFVHNVRKHKTQITNKNEGFAVDSVFIGVLYANYVDLDKKTVLENTHMGGEMRTMDNSQNIDGFDIIRNGLAKVVLNLASRNLN